MTAISAESRHATAARPPIVVTEADYDKLIRFVERQSSAMPRVMHFLQQELHRAELVPAHEVPRDVITMNSRLLFRMTETALSRAVTLVYPAEADLMAGRMSILTPAGVALLGLRAGQSMSWEDRIGETKTLTVQHVLFQPEASGRFEL